MIEDVSGILIDFVGTLVTFRIDRERAFRQMYEELGAAGFRVDFERFREAYEMSSAKYRKIRYEQLVEVSNEVWIQEALRGLGLLGEGGGDGLAGRMADAYFASLLTQPVLTPSAKETLAYLSGRGYRLALVSNFSYAPVPERLLGQFELNRYFSAHAISHRIGYRKPHPAIFERALEGLDVPSEKALMVGDTPTEDVYGAKKLGMRAIQVREFTDDSYKPYVIDAANERYLKPDRKVAHFSDIRELL